MLPVGTTLLGLHVSVCYNLSPRTNNLTGETSGMNTEPDTRAVGGPGVLGPRLTAKVCVRDKSKAAGGPEWVKRPPGQDTPISRTKALKARPRAGIGGEERWCQSRALERETHL